jgi:hypothetical protein
MKSKRRWTPQEDQLLRQESQKQLTSRSLPYPNLIAVFPRFIPFPTPNLDLGSGGLRLKFVPHLAQIPPAEATPSTGAK